MVLYEKILEFIFPTPTICVVCSAKQPVLQLCEPCRMALEQRVARLGQCRRCGSFGVCGDACAVCRQWPRYIDSVQALWPYDGDVREAIQRYKYERESWRAPLWAKLLAPLVPAEADRLIPIPLHVKRLEERGYNQSALIAKHLAPLVDLPAEEGVVVRLTDTPHQVGLSRSARRQNLQKAFSVRRPEALQDAHVLVIDDVLTTGSTFVEMAATLRQAGAKRVSGLMLASSWR